MKTTIFLGSSLSLLLVGAAASAATVNLRADMTDVTEGNATGSAELTFDDVANTLCGKIVYQGLSGPVTKAHIHDSTVDAADPNSHIADLVAAASPMPVRLTLNEDQKAKLLEPGIGYINFHTAANPDGELEGPLVVDPSGAPQACPAAAADAGAPPGDAGGAPPQDTTAPSATEDAGADAPSPAVGGKPEGAPRSLASPSDATSEGKPGCSASAAPTSGGTLGLATLAIVGMALLRGRAARRRAAMPRT